MKIGDKVAYSVQFLKSIGMSHSDMAHGRGEIVEITDLGQTKLARIKWNKHIQVGDLPERVNIANLAKVGLNIKFSQC